MNHPIVTKVENVYCQGSRLAGLSTITYTSSGINKNALLQTVFWRFFPRWAYIYSEINPVVRPNAECTY